MKNIETNQFQKLEFEVCHNFFNRPYNSFHPSKVVQHILYKSLNMRYSAYWCRRLFDESHSFFINMYNSKIILKHLYVDDQLMIE